MGFAVGQFRLFAAGVEREFALDAVFPVALDFAQAVAANLAALVGANVPVRIVVDQGFEVFLCVQVNLLAARFILKRQFVKALGLV